MVVATQHFVSTLIMSTSIIRLFQWKWDAIVAALGTNPYVYKVRLAVATDSVDSSRMTLCINRRLELTGVQTGVESTHRI